VQQHRFAADVRAQLRAASRRPGDHAKAVQRLQGGADRGPADPHLLGEIGFVRQAVSREPPLEDRSKQRLGGALGQRSLPDPRQIADRRLLTQRETDNGLVTSS
jgi:hypothetical protein